MTPTSSPASSGPAGTAFEVQVGAYYLLAMLAGTAPRGLPGTSIKCVQFQRAAEGWPLDDVIVHTTDSLGKSAVLEIQVKRSIAFSPQDPVFRSVVRQIAEASRRQDFGSTPHEIAIATSQISRKIAGAYQDVLTWSRKLGDAATFIDRMRRPGSSNDDMRRFVETFRSHLDDAGTPDDDETVWRLLQRLQILVFDFTAEGSAFEVFAKERAGWVLHPDDAGDAGKLWASLIEITLQTAASGGERGRENLIQDLRQRSFRLAGERRYKSARAALAEASRNALADIDDRVGGVMLTRHERVAAVHAALDSGRFVEIRGDAGVGKSGVLKHFAEQITSEAEVIVLSPQRTTPNGWTSMRADLGFDGTARELLTDLASDGGAILFVDSLDFFREKEQRTVVDLVREAASVPGIAVIVTARRGFGVDEPNWLPADAISRLRRAEPILIEELSDCEVDEIRHAAPALVPLLIDAHPAGAVTRNLFRLTRLASQQEDAPIPQTEVDMAKQWWQTADGKSDGRRERFRLLKSLGEQALLRSDSLDVSQHPAHSVDALVNSETLRDMGNDRVMFYHDVLREWVIANLLHSEPSMIDHLPFDQPAPADLARSLELAARMRLERAADSTSWQSLLERFSRDDVHASWRRTILLAIIRSEIANELLDRTSDQLLADRATILRELIRIIMAVDVQPFSQFFAAACLDPATIPANLNTPSGPTWSRLILWLLKLGENLPVVAIPDVVELYTSWSVGMLGQDPLTPLLQQRLHRWLTDIETARADETFHGRREPFGGKLTDEQIKSLESDLRAHFLLFCHRAPELAAEYLQSLNQHRHNEKTVRSILKFRGALAQAAPAELAELTVNSLINRRRQGERNHRREPDEPFGFLDDLFLPASPAQGPFFELLTHAPQIGLPLIRQLVDYAINSGGREHDDDAINIPLTTGERTFPGQYSYAWSRENSGSYCVTSALMALEAWAHRRIEGGGDFDEVLRDVLGRPGAPAAYLLVAVDLMLSHWPKSLESAIPFLACPELLCIDRERHVRDTFGYPDFFGLTAQPEPVGAASIKDLETRVSRRVPLEQLLAQYALVPDDLRERLTALLQRARVRLRPPDERSDLRDPNFMVIHALNLADPDNWREVSIVQDDGKQMTAHEYVPPESEHSHLAALQEAAQKPQATATMQAKLNLALEDPTHSSAELAAAAVEWARGAAGTPEHESPDEDWIRDEAIVTAAMIVMRDGSAELRLQHAEWAHGIFAQELGKEEDHVHRFRLGLRFNKSAIAFVGMVHSLDERSVIEDFRKLLETAARPDPAAAHGFGVVSHALASRDERLPRALLRCAFAACIRSNGNGSLTEEEIAVRAQRHTQRVNVALQAEMDWLENDEGPEPAWPTFPPEQVWPRRRLRLPTRQAQCEIPEPQQSRRDEYVDHQAAALWLGNVRSLVDVAERPWLRQITQAYAPWTASANGAGLDVHDEVDNPPREWNDAYFNLLAHCMLGLTLPEVKQLALTPIVSLPDTSFFDVVTQFLRNIDAVFFNNCGLYASVAVSIRAMLADRLMASNRWKALRGRESASIEMHIGPAIAVFFFNDHGLTQPAESYLLPKGISQLEPFLPVLADLVESGPSLFVAGVTLNLIEVHPTPAHFRFIITAAKIWIGRFPDAVQFWVEKDIGRRICALIERIWNQDPVLLDTDETLQFDVNQLLAALISLGVADASRLEKALAARNR